MSAAAMTWAARVAAYLAYRRSFGFGLSIEGGQLSSFARFADQRAAERLTLELAADWARASRHPRPISWARRIEVLRGFAAFCLRTDPDTVVNRTGNRGGCLVKVKQVPQREPQAVDNSALRLLSVAHHQSTRATVDG